MTGEAGDGPGTLARVWTLVAGRPRTWRQAIVQAVLLGAAFGALQIWLFSDSPPHQRWFLIWWMPLWLATSLSGYAFWSWRDRRYRALQESGPPR